MMTPSRTILPGQVPPRESIYFRLAVYIAKEGLKESRNQVLQRIERAELGLGRNVKLFSAYFHLCLARAGNILDGENETDQWYEDIQDEEIRGDISLAVFRLASRDLEVSTDVIEKKTAEFDKQGRLFQAYFRLCLDRCTDQWAREGRSFLTGEASGSGSMLGNSRM